MIKKRPGRAKEAFGQQAAGYRRGAPGKRFVGDAGEESLRARADERARVMRMQVAAREAVQRAALASEQAERREELERRGLWDAVGALVVDSARLATTLAFLPLRIARAAAGGFLPRLRTA